MGAFLFNSLGRVWAGVLDMGVPIATKFALILLSQPSHQVWGPGTPLSDQLEHTLINLTGNKLLLIANAM